MRKEFLPKEQSNVIFALSFLIGLTAIFAFYKKRYDLSLICVVVLITSLVHWNDPQYGFRRNLDIFAVCIGFVYLVYLGIIRKVRSFLFWFCLIAVVVLYKSAHVLNQRRIRESSPKTGFEYA